MIDCNDAGIPSSFDNRRFFAGVLLQEQPPQQLPLFKASLEEAFITGRQKQVRRTDPPRMWERHK